jgi:cell division protein FtsB
VKKPVTAIVFILLVVSFVVLLAPRVLQVQSLKARSEELSRKLHELKQQNDALELELRLLRDDPVYLEKIGRQQFNKAKEGEIVYKVVREGQNTKLS